MCQLGHLALPNGPLNADIKPAPHHHPPPSPSLPPSTPLFFPRSSLITSPSHPVPHLVTHLSSPSLSPSPCRSVDQPSSLPQSSPLSPSLNSFEPFPRFTHPLSFFLFCLFKAFFFSPSAFQINELDVSLSPPHLFLPTGSIMPSTLSIPHSP